MIVLLSVVSSSLTLLFNRLAVQSSETLRARQALGVAQALMTEVRMMPFTYCDPQDARFASATMAALGPTGCQTSVETLPPVGAETGEGRRIAPAGSPPPTPPSARFDNVSDYDNFAQPGPSCPGGICDINGYLLNAAGSPLQGCSTLVNTTPQAMPNVPALDANNRPQSLRITVRVRCPGTSDMVLESIRMRHAPNQM
ncbi:MAG: hypothetical protein V4739_00385 [Pseudomonadota bacterium]